MAQPKEATELEASDLEVVFDFESPWNYVQLSDDRTEIVLDGRWNIADLLTRLKEQLEKP